jgi:hypothetical protein
MAKSERPNLKVRPLVAAPGCGACYFFTSRTTKVHFALIVILRVITSSTLISSGLAAITWTPSRPSLPPPRPFLLPRLL